MSDFYCYIHKKADGTPFYVGKGTKIRAYEFSRRTLWYNNIVAKEGGKKNIKIEIYKASNEQNAFDLEKIFIKGLRMFFTLCNLTDGGEGISGLSRSAETKEKISLANSGKPSPFLGGVHTELAKSKISSARKQGNNNFQGHHHSDESKKKISLALTGHKRSPETVEKWRASINKKKSINEENNG